MANKFRSLARVATGEVNKRKFFDNATSAISNATIKMQKIFTNLQDVVASKYNVAVKQINSKDTVTTLIETSSEINKVPMMKRVLKCWRWYEQLIGLDLLETCRQQVVVAQNKLFKCQEGRRLLNKENNELNEKLREIYGELVATKRDDPKYVQLTITENKYLQDQTKIIGHLNLLEKEERDHFTLLATAIKEYHDSQTVNTQKYKYLSIIVSASLAVISLTGSMIYNNKRLKDIRNVIEESREKHEYALVNSFRVLQDNLNVKFSEIHGIMDGKNEKHKNGDQGIIGGILYIIQKPTSYTVRGLGACYSFIKNLVYG